MRLRRFLVHAAFLNASQKRLKIIKIMADAEMILCGRVFTANQVVLRCWKDQIMSCSCVDEHSATLHYETCSACIFLMKAFEIW